MKIDLGLGIFDFIVLIDETTMDKISFTSLFKNSILPEETSPLS